MTKRWILKLSTTKKWLSGRAGVVISVSLDASSSSGSLFDAGGLSARSEPSAEYEVEGLESTSVSGMAGSSLERIVCRGVAFTRSVMRSK